MRAACALALSGMLATTGCTGEQGPPGADGMDGTDGQDGMDGDDGTDGTDGDDGADGDDGEDGTDGEDGEDGVGFDDSSDIPTFVTELVDQVAAGTLPEGTVFPLDARATDSMRAVEGLKHETLVTWLEPITFRSGNDDPHFGANADYIAYFGDGWDTTAGDAPQWNGSGTSGWLWVNHEYVSNDGPTPTTPPSGQYLTLASWMRGRGLLANDPLSSTWEQSSIDAIITQTRRQLGGSWVHIVRDPASGTWSVDRNAANRRFDATSATLSRVTGMAVSADTRDDGTALPAGVVAGTLANCSGGQTPWGTVITAEENAQDYYGDAEACWSGQRFTAGPCAPGGDVAIVTAPSTSSGFGRHSSPGARHPRDVYGFLTEIDPSAAPDEWYGRNTEGVGHRKLGAMGRAHWENATFATDEDWQLIEGQPVVVYAADDRQSGHIYRFVSAQPYTAGMTRAQIRALLDQGTLHVAHFADMAQNGYELRSGASSETMRGAGTWIELSLTSTDLAPNGAALGDATMTVGAALASATWNGIGRFATDDAVRRALFTASQKIGVRELNRPEDVEWNPRDPSGTPRLYVAFTNQTGQRALMDDGSLAPTDATAYATAAYRPNDTAGSIFAIEEGTPATPATSDSFTFWIVARGNTANGAYDFGSPDNLMIDGYGHVWFGTDGTFGRSGHADAVYYLDLDPAHRTTPTATYGRPFRVIAVPSDAEATGPTLSSDMRTFFVAVQHPGESVWSTWPATDLYARPRSGVVAISRRAR
ncbi:PhoX family protein [Sandaracinus amylolyticus]|nr:alkaline phosphatase PhoX [Sandaracinus amylolyticus]